MEATADNVDKKVKVATEVVRKAVEEFIYHQESINPNVKQTKSAKKYKISAQTINKAIKTFKEKKVMKFFCFNSFQCHQLKANVRERFNSGEVLSKETCSKLAPKLAHQIAGHQSPGPSKAWCSLYLKKFPDSCADGKDFSVR